MNEPLGHHLRVEFLKDVLVVQVLEQDDGFAQLLLDFRLGVQDQRGGAGATRRGTVPGSTRRARGHGPGGTQGRRHGGTLRGLFQQEVAVARQL